MKRLFFVIMLMISVCITSVTYANQGLITKELKAIGCDGCDDEEKAAYLPVSLDREVISVWFRKTFPDGTKISTMKVVNEDGKPYFVEEGSNQSGDCRIARTPLGVIDYGDTHVIYLMAAGKTTETCAGKGCSRCKFSQVPGGGCLCLRGSGDCDHTIVKTLTMLR